MDIEHVGQPDHLNPHPRQTRHPWPAVAAACNRTPGDWYRILRNYPTTRLAQRINDNHNRHLPADRYQARTVISRHDPDGRRYYDIYVRAYPPVALPSNRDRGSDVTP